MVNVDGTKQNDIFLSGGFICRVQLSGLQFQRSFRRHDFSYSFGFEGGSVLSFLLFWNLQECFCTVI